MENQRIAIVDVDYREPEREAVAACVVAEDWADEAPVEERVARSPIAADYRPGELYRRELPPLREVLEGVAGLGAVVVDGYVWLEEGPALGGHLYRALGERIPVIGIAKNPLAVAGPCAEVHRGGSRKPLYVSAAGCDLEDAADRVLRMHGPHRIPTLVRRADQLSRSAR